MQAVRPGAVGVPQLLLRSAESSFTVAAHALELPVAGLVPNESAIGTAVTKATDGRALLEHVAQRDAGGIDLAAVRTAADSAIEGLGRLAAAPRSGAATTAQLDALEAARSGLATARAALA